MARRAPENEEYITRAAKEKAIRLEVAEQARGLVADRDRLGSRDEFSMRLGLLLAAEKQVVQAQARQQQARSMGLPVTEHVHAEFEARVLLRQAVMETSAAAAGWVVAMDFETDSRYRGFDDYMGGID